MNPALTEEIERRMAAASGMWLFLDYDGTLAEFAPTPDDVLPDPALIELIERLARLERVRVTVLSGRRMAHIRELLPVAGVILAGTYGLEIEHPVAGPALRVDAGVIRPVLEVIAKRWRGIIRGRAGFYLEDKGLALALHARFADDAEAEQALAAARLALEPVRRLPEVFRILGGHKFLEVGPAQAGKGAAVAYLVDTYAWPGSFLVYVGDDDKDEEAYEAIREHGGVAVLTAAAPRPTHAQYRLDSPAEVRAWLADLIERLEQSGERRG